jgi:hypothetical protein
MDAAFLGKLFGRDQKWHGPCTVILDAEAALYTHGGDCIVAGGVKMFAPRTVSGRVTADAVCLLPEHAALLIIQQQKVRQGSGEENVRQSLVIADLDRIAAVEFSDTTVLAALGVTAPVPRGGSLSHPGTSPRPA